jgi:hypothetical protein
MRSVFRSHNFVVKVKVNVMVDVSKLYHHLSDFSGKSYTKHW